ncbi:MAG TPA: hypothetical protein VNY05_13195 [Candidatus Acidoferrales bacterium]|nr:hypothetical protein [Candidatus Acidoferrales bacterium]
MHRQGMVSIWFFIGAPLLASGVLILAAALLESPPEHPVVLSELHAGIWWGALLIVMGGIYTVKFLPGKGKQHK